jgi:hypothetical protein
MLALDHDPDVVIGVDTDNHTHTTAGVASTGVEHLTVPADPAGYRKPLSALGSESRVAKESERPSVCSLRPERKL